MAEAGSGGQTTKDRPRKWRTILLFASLAVNFAVVGVVAGAYVNRDRFVPRLQGMGARDIGFAPFISALEQEDRRALGRALRGQGPDPREMGAALQDQFTRLFAALAAEPFDPEAVEAIFEEQQVLLTANQDVGRQALVNQFAQMSQEERMEYAVRLREMLARGPDRDKDRRPPPGDRDD